MMYLLDLILIRRFAASTGSLDNYFAEAKQFITLHSETFGQIKTKSKDDMDMDNFDPNGVGVNNGNYFGLPFDEEEAKLVLLSVPWDVTASYGAGAAFGPDAIIEASTQLDLYDVVSPDEWRAGIGTIGIDYSIQDRSARLRNDAAKIMAGMESGSHMIGEFMLTRKLERINNMSLELNEYVYGETIKRLRLGQTVGIVGGDHSTPFGAIKAVAEFEKGIGILHLDAHCDLRKEYEGFTHSHASIMYNVLNEIPQVERIVQVGPRDFCDEEAQRAANSGRVVLYDDYTLASRRFEGEAWGALCREIVEKLPQKVYISFDIDALSLECCPNTGTPVAGGLTFNEAVYLLNEVAKSGRRIVGFDLVEVAPGREGRWDANVGARLLYKMCGIALKSREG